ncbi:MAG: pilus assembly protein N-terminal domain-containing protein, partial [Bacillota bacterium]
MISPCLPCGGKRAGLWVFSVVAAAVAALVIATASAAASETAGAQQTEPTPVQAQEQAQQVQQSGAVIANRTFAVVVGESRILQVNGLVRVAVADPTIADVVVVSKTEVIVNGKAEGRTTLHVWDTSGRSSYNVRVCVDNADLIREIEETIGMSGVIARFARSTLLLDGSVETDGDSERAERIAKAYADKVLNLLTVRRPTLPPQPPVVDASEVHSAIGVQGVSVRVLKDTVILEGQVESPLDAERAEKIARIFTNNVLNFVVVNPPPPPPVADEGEAERGEPVAAAPQEVEPRPAEAAAQQPAAPEAGGASGERSARGEAGSGSGQSGEAPGVVSETTALEPAAGPEESDPDQALRDAIVAAVRDPAVEVTVVKGTV